MKFKLIKVMVIIFALSLLSFSPFAPISIKANEMKNSEVDKNISLKIIDSKESITSDKLLGDIEKSRGQKIDKRIKVDLLKENKDKGYIKDTAYGYPIIDLTDKQKKEIKELIQNENLVYLYGDKVSVEAANEIFGTEIKPLLTLEQLKYEYEQKNSDYTKEEIVNLAQFEFDRQNKTYQVVGLLNKNNQKQIYLSNLDLTDSSNTKKTEKPKLKDFVDSMLDNIDQSHIEDISLFSSGSFVTTLAADTPIKDWTDLNYTKTVGGVKIATLNGDFYLYKNPDPNPDSDYFGLKSKLELTKYNGSTSLNMQVNNDLPTAPTDNVQGWEPKSTASSYKFEVSLPLGFSWEFEPGGNVQVTTSGSQTSDYANWYFQPTISQISLISPCRVEPGIDWVSKGTFANMDVTSNGKVSYNSVVYTLPLNFDVRYDY